MNARPHPSIAFLLRLYPAGWRARYGDEFEALLAERPLGPFDVADLLLGALDAHLHLRGLGSLSERQRGFAMTLRIGGYAAILGSILWIIGVGVASALRDTAGLASLGTASAVIGSILLLVALTGLSAFQARLYPRLTWAAFVIPALGMVFSVVGIVGMTAPGDAPFVGDLSAWNVWALGTMAMFVGSGLFAIATWRARTLSRGATALLGSTSVAIVPVAIFAAGGPEVLASLLFVVSLVGFTGGWVALGIGALRTAQRTPTANAPA